MNDKRLTYGFGGTIVTILIAFIASWISINSRISVLEVQVQDQQKQADNSNRNMEEIRSNIYEIKQGIQHLTDIKADRPNLPRDE